MKDAEIAKMLEGVERILALYANEDSYKSPSSGFAHQVDPEPSFIQKDKGEMARQGVRFVKQWRATLGATV